nr:MAG TPA: hypothetical protein [Bacteriophage sp.]
MTCKDCYHYDVCHRRINSIDFLPFIKGKVSISSIMYKKCDDVEKHCLHFKDKSLIIELPCKVGKEIYVLNRENIPQRMILDEPDIRCHCAKEDNLCMALCDDKKHGICAYRLKNDGSDIGKKVFRTKKEAEARPKELNQIANQKLHDKD